MCSSSVTFKICSRCWWHHMLLIRQQLRGCGLQQQQQQQQHLLMLELADDVAVALGHHLMPQPPPAAAAVAAAAVAAAAVAQPAASAGAVGCAIQLPLLSAHWLSAVTAWKVLPPPALRITAAVTHSSSSSSSSSSGGNSTPCSMLRCRCRHVTSGVTAGWRTAVVELLLQRPRMIEAPQELEEGYVWQDMVMVRRGGWLCFWTASCLLERTLCPGAPGAWEQ